MAPNTQYTALMRAIRMTVFLGKNPLREARAIVASCVAEQLCAKP